MTWEIQSGCGIAGLARVVPRSIDVVMTDPPYAASTHENQPRARALGFDPMDKRLMGRAAKAIARAVKRWALVFTDDRLLERWREALAGAGMEIVRVGAWIKDNPAPQLSGDRPAQGMELIVIAHHPGAKRWNGGGAPAVWRCPVAGPASGEERLHAAQKPLALMETLVRQFSERGETIADLFAGSGTTGVAALRAGRSFMGWEISEDHARAARLRLEAAREQTQLFAESA